MKPRLHRDSVAIPVGGPAPAQRIARLPAGTCRASVSALTHGDWPRVVDLNRPPAASAVPAISEVSTYDPATRRMLADVQTRNLHAVIDPATRTIIRRIALQAAITTTASPSTARTGSPSSAVTATSPCSRST